MPLSILSHSFKRESHAQADMSSVVTHRPGVAIRSSVYISRLLSLNQSLVHDWLLTALAMLSQLMYTMLSALSPSCPKIDSTCMHMTRGGGGASGGTKCVDCHSKKADPPFQPSCAPSSTPPSCHVIAHLQR